ncbi:MAG TPA: VWA domain-containing protein, partial [bacterium]
DAARRGALAKGFRERWGAAEEREAAAAMEALAGRLVTRLGRRRRRSRRGRLDMTATLRANLVHGGVPFVLRRKARVPSRRDLVLLADLSGSVRRAASLFLLILGRLRGAFAGVRAFAYVDRPAEIPRELAGAPAAEIAAALAPHLPLDALSDHGEMLRRFNRDFPRAAGGRSVVVILGDARNNRFPAQEWELETLRRRCRHLVWIVPEPVSLWGSGDSAIAAYAPLCDRVLAAPNPLALAAAAADLARGIARPRR